MALTEWLVDTSAVVRLETASDSSEWAARIERGLVRISVLTKLELGFAARTAEEHRRRLAEPPLSLMPDEHVIPATEHRALEVQHELARIGHHRAPSTTDLLVAASAELAGLTVLHVDKDFELIAEITGQPVERLAIESAA